MTSSVLEHRQVEVAMTAFAEADDGGRRLLMNGDRLGGDRAISPIVFQAHRPNGF